MASREGPYSCGAAVCAACEAAAEGRSGVDTGEGLLRGTGSASAVVDAVDVCAGRPPVLLVSASSSDDDDEEHGKVPTGSLGNICRGSRRAPDDILAAVLLMLLLVIGRYYSGQERFRWGFIGRFFGIGVSEEKYNPAQRRFQFDPLSIH